MTPHIREGLLQTQINGILQMMLVYKETQETIKPEDIEELLSDAPNIHADEFEATFKRLGLEGRPGTFYYGLTYYHLISIIEPILNAYYDFLNELYDDFYDTHEDEDLEYEPEEIPESDTTLSDITNTILPK